MTKITLPTIDIEQAEMLCINPPKSINLKVKISLPIEFKELNQINFRCYSFEFNGYLIHIELELDKTFTVFLFEDGDLILPKIKGLKTTEEIQEAVDQFMEFIQ